MVSAVENVVSVDSAEGSSRGKTKVKINMDIQKSGAVGAKPTAAGAHTKKTILKLRLS